jgi:hypothetical protein
MSTCNNSPQKYHNWQYHNPDWYPVWARLVSLHNQIGIPAQPSNDDTESAAAASEAFQLVHVLTACTVRIELVGIRWPEEDCTTKEGRGEGAASTQKANVGCPMVP